MPEHIVVVGDAMLDRDVDGRADRIAPDAPVPVVHTPVSRTRPGGAGLAARLAQRLGARVTLVTALGDDAAGDELGAIVAADGVELIALRRPATPVKTRIRVEGHAIVRIDEGDDDGRIRYVDALAGVDAVPVDAVLVADYGRGVSDHPAVRTWLEARAAAGPLVWDPHPRGGDPVQGARLVTPNRAEVRARGYTVGSVGSLAGAAEDLAGRWHAQGVAITLGRDGAVLGVPGRLPLAVPAPHAVHGDPCGAGDCLAATAAVHAARGAVLTDMVTRAVAEASRYVAAGGAGALDAVLPGSTEHAPGPADARRGTLVATSGCFDLLHAGHVSMLQAARALGDRLVVLLNSDHSVQDLKGAERPIVHEGDRAAVLRGLECVDDVVVFDDPTPVRVLEQVRPDIFVKGDDYGVGSIPEAAALRRWGGAVVVVPYLEGRSTTRLIRAAGQERIEERRRER